MLTHANLLSNAIAMYEATPREGGVQFNWLPFSHIYARTVDHYLCQAAALPLCLAESWTIWYATLVKFSVVHVVGAALL